MDQHYPFPSLRAAQLQTRYSQGLGIQGVQGFGVQGLPWHSAQARISCDKVVSSASQCGEELGKIGFCLHFFSRRTRRPSHPSLFLVGFRLKLMPGFFLPGKIHSSKATAWVQKRKYPKSRIWQVLSGGAKMPPDPRLGVYRVMTLKK